MLQAFAPVSIDMYLPAMPQMEQVFHTTAAAVQYTMVSLWDRACTDPSPTASDASRLCM